MTATDHAGQDEAAPPPLPPHIAPHLDAIRALCREYGVARLEIFGSAVTADFDPARSDVDFLVDYLPETDLGPWITHYFALRDALAALVGRPVDLVMAGASQNRFFLRSLDATRRLVYAA